MHDPCTQAFVIRYPWRAYKNPRPGSDFERNYRDPFITIWHRDPERDGSDDSCGWSYPKVSDKRLVEKLKSDIDFLTEHHGGLSVQKAREGQPSWWLLWMQRASYWATSEKTGEGRGLTSTQLAAMTFGQSFPGKRDDDWSEDRDSGRQAWIFARCYLQLVRPWWKHPRWHVWHWSFQIHPLQSLRRWLFDRCDVCGRGFQWGESGITSNWDRVSKWFGLRTVGLRHMDCYGQRCSSPAEGEP